MNKLTGDVVLPDNTTKKDLLWFRKVLNVNNQPVESDYNTLTLVVNADSEFRNELIGSGGCLPGSCMALGFTFRFEEKLTV